MNKHGYEIYDLKELGESCLTLGLKEKTLKVKGMVV